MNVNFGSRVLSGTALIYGFTNFRGGSPDAVIVVKAFELIRQRACNNNGCNSYFKGLENGRTFNEIYMDENVWINYCTRGFGKDEIPWVGKTSLDGKKVNGSKEYDIAIHKSAFNLPSKLDPVAEVAAIIIHEMAHVAGAPPMGCLAELSLMYCGFHEQYDPATTG